MPGTTLDVEIRPMLADDIAAAAQVVLDGGWSDRSGFFAWAVDQSTCYPIVADEAGRIVGTGLATANGRVGWVGAIFVAPDRRRNGLGSALSKATIAELERNGCTTQVLIATDQGRPIYERLGFRIQTRYVLAQAPDGPPPPEDGVVRAYDPDDFDAIAGLDRKATGEDRSATLRSLTIDPSLCRVATRSDGSIGGFVLRAPWGSRALVATEPDLALALLDERRRSTDHPFTIGVLEANIEGRRRLARAGWAERPGGPRLLRGEPLIWRPDWIYGQFTGALG